MSGETEMRPSSWTIDTLQVHLERMVADQNALFMQIAATHASLETFAVLQAQVAAITELMEAKFVTFRVLVESQADKVALALTASKEAIDKAEIATSKAIDKAEIGNDKQFDSIRESIDKVSQQQAAFITRAEAVSAIERNTERINDLSARLDRAEGPS